MQSVRKTTLLSPEEIISRKFKAKCRFRAAVRLVMCNTHWLQEETYVGDSVIKRVEQAMRVKKGAPKLELSFSDKALLNKPATDRTDKEKSRLYRVIGGIKCFKIYPDIVKKKLAAITYFNYYGPHRILLKEGYTSIAMYFLVSGECTVTKVKYDAVLDRNINIFVAKLKPGDIVGEISLLQDIPRTATVTTDDHCQFLMLLKEDFKNVLQTTIQQQWDKVKEGMKQFTYLKELDEVSLREGCLVGKLKSYEEDEIILGDGIEVPNHVYFILEGRCKMIENLKIETYYCHGVKKYRLLDDYAPSVTTDQSVVDLAYFDNYFERRRKSSVIKSPSLTEEESTFFSVDGSKRKSKSVQITYDDDLVTAVHRATEETNLVSEPPSLSSANYETYFMQVCAFNKGSTFNLGEDMHDRRIVAESRVTVLLLPLVFLLQKANNANIWIRIRHYLQKTLPTKKMLFKEFLNQRHWEEHRDRLALEIYENSGTFVNTSLADVPFSIRMEKLISKQVKKTGKELKTEKTTNLAEKNIFPPEVM